jgi:hypothetical protein
VKIGESTGFSGTKDSRRQRNCATGIVESRNLKEDRKHLGRGHVVVGGYFGTSGTESIRGQRGLSATGFTKFRNTKSRNRSEEYCREHFRYRKSGREGTRKEALQ